MNTAIRIHKNGGPEALVKDTVPLNEPSAGEIRIKQSNVGLNFIDVYMRTGLYPLPALPATLGMEAAGTVDAVGTDVTDFKVGDRVAYVAVPPGAYCQYRVIDAAKVVALPDSIPEDIAAAVMLKGLTAQYLLRRSYPVKAGETILIHAAAGGVGLIVCQWAKHLGATVIGTVGSDEKAELAKAHGCDHTIVYTRENFKERVQEITDGKGVHVVYDSIGKDTFFDSLDCLRPLGMMVTFGNATGAVPEFSPMELAKRGSLSLIRPTVFTYIAERDDLLAMSKELFDVISIGAVKIEINQRFALADVGKAHEALESRKTTGCTVLTV